ncbi:MAG: molybdopterin-dependent oxidoreductase [Pseudomonadota bacterium]
MTGLRGADIAAFYGLVARTPRTVTVYSQGVNQSSAGTDKVNAIINCHLATGRIGKVGAGPFSVTGQPNAMGGRETGGLANMLAAHMELANAGHRDLVARFWGVDRVPDQPGLKAIDMFEAVASGQIKALWIMATNPVDSLPDADRVRAAIAQCPFVAVSDVTANTDTTELAHVLLPALAWGEKDGTVTNSERRISRQRAFLHPPGEARADWWQICEVARRLGYGDAFSYAGPSQIFSEYAALTGFENAGTRDLDVSALAGIAPGDYAVLAPFQWPRPRDEAPRETRFFANGNFYTPDGRATFIETRFRPPASTPDEAHPLQLNTGRIRDQWHTMTRTAKTPRLAAHYSEPFAEIHPDDARAAGIATADLVELASPLGRVVVRAVITDRGKRGSVFVPMHWTGQFASDGRVCVLVEANTDPVSGQPELKYSPVSLRRVSPAWFGFAVTSRRPDPAQYAYAAIAPASGGGWRVELADSAQPESWDQLALDLLGGPASPGANAPGGDGAGNAEANGHVEVLSYHDAASNQHRFAAFADGACCGLLFVGPQPVAVSRTWAISQFASQIADGDRLRLLAGRPGAGVPDRGAIICACFEVGQNEITDAITRQGAVTVDAVGACTQAGTNCGSCRAELGRLIHEFALAKTG